MGTSARIPIFGLCVRKNNNYKGLYAHRRKINEDAPTLPYKGYEKGLVQIRDFARPPQVENHLNAEAGLLTCFRSSGLPTIH